MQKQIFFAVTVLLSLYSCKPEKDVVPDLTRKLAAHFTLNEKAVDEVSGVEGVAIATTKGTNRFGESGKCFCFNKSDSSRIEFSDYDSWTLTESFTISFWVKVKDTSGRIAVISKRSPFGPFEYSIDNFFYRNKMTFDNWIASGGGTVYGIDPMKAVGDIQLDKWQHFAFVGDGEKVIVFVDGERQSGSDERNQNIFFENTNAPLVIGNGGGWAGNYYFDGCIDDIRIYHRALDENTVKYLWSH